MDSEEKKLAELYSLDAEQIAWRRAKISQLGSAEYFAQVSNHAQRGVYFVNVRLLHPGQSRYCGAQGDCRSLWANYRRCRPRGNGCRPHINRLAPRALHYQD